jgi:beta-glucosidase
MCTAVLPLASIALAAPRVAVVTGDKRVDRLLSEMTLAEKLTLIHGTQEDPKSYQGQAGYLAGIPRLGIPGLRFADGPPGVLTRHPAQALTATMGVAATFSRQLAQANGVVIGREARALGIDVSLQPFINIDRDLEYGRGYNTFGEDPFLTGEIGAAEIEGIQSQHVMAMAKHYVGYDSDADGTWIDDQTLHEVYLAPFAAAVRAGVAAIMCSYNRINGIYACGNESTLTRILRHQLGFKGFVTSDWGATHAVTFINAGLDMEMPGEPPLDASSWGLPTFFDSRPIPPLPPPAKPGADDVGGDMFGGHMPEEPAPASEESDGAAQHPRYEKMTQALRDGTVSESAINRAAGRVLYEMERFGFLDGLSKHRITMPPIEADARIIEKTSEAGAVLLKNEGHVLPLEPADLNSIVLIGPTARQVDAVGISGECSVGLTARQVGPLEAMRRISGNERIRFAVDDDMTGSPIPPGAFSHDGKAGLLRQASGARVTDPQINFTRAGGNALPPNLTASWTGKLAISYGGDYWIYLQALGTNARIRLDGRWLAGTGAAQGGDHGDILQANQDNTIPTTDGLDDVRRSVRLAAGLHDIEVSVSPDSSDAPVQVRLNWYTPKARAADHAAAIAAAKASRIAVVFLWTRLEPVFGLPGAQDKLVEEIAAVNPNTIVVLNTSQPVALPWIRKVKAVLQMWWPGDEGGWSTANLLLGKVSPAGRLPVTWAKRLEDYAATDPRFPERSKRGVGGRTVYSEGVNVGYRWFDKERLEPLFPFGYGLSYTSFAYSGLEVRPATDGGLDVHVTIRNTGTRDADEVAQVYLGAPRRSPADVQFPVRALVGFERTNIRAGASRGVTIHVPLRQLQYWSTRRQTWVMPTGKRLLSVGASSRDLRLEQTIG